MTVRAGLLLVAVIGIAPIGLYASRWTLILLGLLAVAALADRRAAMRAITVTLRTPTGLAALAFALFATVSAGWAPSPDAALTAAGKLALVTVLGLVFVHGVRTLSRETVAVMEVGLLGFFGLFAVLCLVEVTTGAAFARTFKSHADATLNFTSHGASIAAILIAPLAIAVARRTGRGWLALAVPGLALALFEQLPMGVLRLTVIATTAAGAAAYLWPRKAPLALAGLLSALVLATPLLSAYAVTPSRLAAQGIELPWSWKHRIVIWQFTSKLALERPWFGHGLDRAAALSREPATVAAYQSLVVAEGVGELAVHPPLHPHNAVIQIWYELGLAGALLLCGVFGALAYDISRRVADRFQSALWTGLLVSVLSIGSISYGAWQKWWLAGVWVAIALGVLVHRGFDESARRRLDVATG